MDSRDLVATLPERQPHRDSWHRTKSMPCACVLHCSACKEYLPITSFYVLKNGRGRRCVNGEKRNSICSKCSITKTMGRPIEQRIYDAAKARAKRRGLPFDIELSDVQIPTHCPVLGIPLRSVVGCGMGSIKARNNSPSIDRIDNNKGYVKGNTIIISMRANNLKSDGTLEEIFAIADFFRNYSV